MLRHFFPVRVRTFSACTSLLLPLLGTLAFANDSAPILPRLPKSPVQVVSTVPANGDVNPYGVAFAPEGFASAAKAAHESAKNHAEDNACAVSAKKLRRLAWRHVEDGARKRFKQEFLSAKGQH